MGKKARGKHRLDKFYHLAKEQGYRSRASFKLIQLNRRYGFLQNCKSCIDLCAAPGGWLQVAAKHMPVNSLCIGVDLDPIRPIRGCQTFVGDITTQTCRQTLKKMLNSEKCDVVLHDGAPNVGGAWSSEAATQTILVLESLKLASEFLVPKGAFVTKIFRSKDYNALMYAFNQLFTKVEAHKPAASRNTSAEIFVVCMGYKAPSKIDPRLLDQKYLFSDVEDTNLPAGPEALLKDKIKQKRHRHGYEEGVSVLRKEASALEFVLSEKPVEMLGRYNMFHIAGRASIPSDDQEDAEAAAWQASFIASHAACNKEIQSLAEDLQVLGRKEYKQLLRWRLAVRKDLLAEIARRKKESGEDDEEDEEEEAEGKEGEEDVDPEQGLLAEMEAIKDRMDRHDKRLKKRRQKMKKKARERASAGAASADDLLDSQAEGLFQLKKIRGKDSIKVADDTSAPDKEEMEAMESDEGSDVSSGSSIDLEEEQRRFDDLMDQYLEESFQRYQERHGEGRASGKKRRRRRVGDDEEGDLDKEADEGTELADNRFDSSDEEDNELMVSLEGKKGPVSSDAVVAQQWFSQDIFKDATMEDDADEPADDSVPRPVAKKAKTGKPEAKSSAKASGKGANGTGKGLPATDKTAEGDDDSAGSDFEVVPQAKDDSGDGSSEDDDDLDYLSDDAKAEILAIAKKMLKRKVKDNIVDAAYSRFAFNDEGLPKWFEADEMKHMRPAPILTPSEMEAEKERVKAIDARPIKKVAEAKARKRKRMAERLEKARTKATVIAAQEDVPSSAKLRDIQKLYSQAKNNGYSQKSAKKPSRRDDQQGKKKGPRLDSRLRADQARGKKAMKLKKDKAKGKGGGKSGGRRK